MTSWFSSGAESEEQSLKELQRRCKATAGALKTQGEALEALRSKVSSQEDFKRSLVEDLQSIVDRLREEVKETRAATSAAGLQASTAAKQAAELQRPVEQLRAELVRMRADLAQLMPVRSEWELLRPKVEELLDSPRSPSAPPTPALSLKPGGTGALGGTGLVSAVAAHSQALATLRESLASKWDRSEPLVTMDQLQELQTEMSSVRGVMDFAVLKAGFLALAAADCSATEKEEMLETLRSKEQELTARPREAPREPGRQSPLAGDDSSFVVYVDGSSGMALGMDVQVVLHGPSLARAVRVARVGDSGLIPAWNRAQPDKAVRVGDLVRCVNGKQSSANELAKELQQSVPLELIIERVQST